MLSTKLKNYSIILASGSPRRQQFLKDLGIDFTIKLREVEEIYPSTLKGVEITDFLAELKAGSFKDLKKNEILITSDTIVWLENKAIGKPNDRTDAIRILKSLSGKKHEVLTSICLKTSDSIKIVNDITQVYFKTLTEEEDGILADLIHEQWHAVDIGGYYKADPDKTKAVMRPSKILNEALAAVK